VSDDIVLGRAGQFNVQVRDVTLSNHAGIVMIRSFADRLGVSEVLDNELSVKQRERGFTESESVMSLVTSMILGGSCLLDLNVLRGDQGTQMLMTSQKVALGTTQVPSPTTMGELLRKFDLGDIWDLHRVMQTLQGRVRLVQRQSLQGMDCCTLDIDSSVYEQASDQKAGSCRAYNGEIGYHPLFAFWHETGELVMSHLMRGSAHPVSKAVWFLNQTLKRVPGDLPKKLRADSAFYSRDVVAWCEHNKTTFGITADQTAPLIEKIEALPDPVWQDHHLRHGVVQVAE